MLAFLSSAAAATFPAAIAAWLMTQQGYRTNVMLFFSDTVLVIIIMPYTAKEVVEIYHLLQWEFIVTYTTP